MTVLRHYTMKAAEGRGEELRDALTTLAALVEPLAGCETVELFADPRDAETFVFVEHWASIDAHKAAGAALGKDAFAPVMAVLAGPPEGRYLESLPLD
jgi:quinol monooxygenase YgiN